MLTAALNPVVQIVKVLGEGGFSFVYLAQDEGSGVSIVVRRCYDALRPSTRMLT